MIKYFAFGSNMNLPHLQGWLRRFGVEPEGVSDPRCGVVRDYRLRTNYLTASGLGAANIELSHGEVIEGILLAISSEVREVLRAKEGFPCRYEEIDINVALASNGQTISAFTYRVTPAHRLPFDVPISQRYRSLILDGAKAAPLSTDYQCHLQSMLKTPMTVDRSLSSWRGDDILINSTDKSNKYSA